MRLVGRLDLHRPERDERQRRRTRPVRPRRLGRRGCAPLHESLLEADAVHRRRHDVAERHREGPRGQGAALQRARLRPERSGRRDRDGRVVRSLRKCLGRTARHRDHRCRGALQARQRSGRQRHPARDPGRQVAAAAQGADGRFMCRHAAGRGGHSTAEEQGGGRPPADGDLDRRRGRDGVLAPQDRRRRRGVHDARRAGARALLRRVARWSVHDDEVRRCEWRRHVPELHHLLGRQGEPPQVRHRDPLVRGRHVPGDEARRGAEGDVRLRERRRAPLRLALAPLLVQHRGAYGRADPATGGSEPEPVRTVRHMGGSQRAGRSGPRAAGDRQGR